MKSYIEMTGKRSEGINSHMGSALKASKSVFNTPTTLYNHNTPGHPMDIYHFLKVEKGRDTASLTWLSGESSTCRVRIGEPVIVKIPQCMAEREDLGRYRIMEVTHIIDSLGVYHNTFRGIPASMEYIPVENVHLPVARPTIAIVMNNEDPENKGRVQVQYIWQQEENKTTNWVRVRSLDAGSSDTVAQNRGFVFIPEKGDQVLIDYEMGDPARPFVSGSMFHRKNGKGGETDNQIKSIITRSGIQIVFNDNEGSLLIADAGGSSWNMDGKGNISMNAPKNISIIAGEHMEMKCGSMEVTVANDRRDTIGKNHTASIGTSKKVSIGENHECSIKGNEKTIISGNEMHQAVEIQMEATSGDLIMHAANIATFMGGADVEVSKG